MEPPLTGDMHCNGTESDSGIDRSVHKSIKGRTKIINPEVLVHLQKIIIWLREPLQRQEIKFTIMMLGVNEKHQQQLRFIKTNNNKPFILTAVVRVSSVSCPLSLFSSSTSQRSSSSSGGIHSVDEIQRRRSVEDKSPICPKPTWWSLLDRRLVFILYCLSFAGWCVAR